MSLTGKINKSALQRKLSNDSSTYAERRVAQLEEKQKRREMKQNQPKSEQEAPFSTIIRENMQQAGQNTEVRRKPRPLASGRPLPACYGSYDEASTHCRMCHAAAECDDEQQRYEEMFGPMVLLAALGDSVAPPSHTPVSPDPNELTNESLARLYNGLLDELYDSRYHRRFDTRIPSHRDDLRKMRRFLIEYQLPPEPFIYVQMVLCHGVVTHRHIRFSPGMCWTQKSLERWNHALDRTSRSRFHVTEENVRNAIPTGYGRDYFDLVAAEQSVGGQYLSGHLMLASQGKSYTFEDAIADSYSDLTVVWWALHPERQPMLPEKFMRHVKAFEYARLRNPVQAAKYRYILYKARCEMACLISQQYHPAAPYRINVFPSVIDNLWEYLAEPCHVLLEEFSPRGYCRNDPGAGRLMVKPSGKVRFPEGEAAIMRLAQEMAESTDDGCDKDDYPVYGDEEDDE